MLKKWNAYPEYFSLSRALEICSQYLLLRTVILQKKVVGCPSCKCYFLELIRLLTNYRILFHKNVFFMKTISEVK